jgi:hypothetical protein
MVDVFAPTIGADFLAAITFVPADPRGFAPLTAPANALNGPLLQQRFENGGFVALSRSQYKSDRLASTINPEVYLGAKTAL